MTVWIGGTDGEVLIVLGGGLWYNKIRFLRSYTGDIVNGGVYMARNKMEYLESKYSPEEAQRARDAGLVNLFGTYVTQKESDNYWASQEDHSLRDTGIMLAFFAVVGGTIYGAYRGIKWLTSWRIEK